MQTSGSAATMFHVTALSQTRTMTTPTAERVHKHRLALRAAGLRPVQIWVADTRRAGFADECRRQSEIIAAGAEDKDAQDWLMQVADTDGWR